MNISLKNKKEIFVVFCVAFVVGIIYYFSSPQDTNVRWPDAYGHSMNGIFVLDAIKAFPFNSPMEWAYKYYNQYPGITFGFYPPLPSILLASYYALFGLSASTTVIFMATFVVLLFIALYFFARNFMGQVSSLTAAMLLFGTSEILIWGRQMMLEVPMLAFLLGSFVYFIKYLNSDKWRDFALAAVFMVAALNTKQTAGIFIFPMFVFFVIEKKAAGLKRAHLWWIIFISAILMIPLMTMQYNFGSFNILSVVQRNDVPVDRFSVEGILWYIVRIVEMTNLPFTIMVVVGLVALSLGFNRMRSRKYWFLILSCLLVCWVVLTLISLKEMRHALIVMPFLSVLAVAPFMFFKSEKFCYIAFLFSILLLFNGLYVVNVETLEGPQRAADYIVKKMPEGGRVAISAHLYEPFVFQMRIHDLDRRYHVTRIGKLLLDINIMPRLGLNPKDYDQKQVADLVAKNNFNYIVLEPNDFMEAEVMRRFAKVLQNEPYEHVATIDSTTKLPSSSLLIYKNNSVLSNYQPDSIQIPCVISR